MAVTISATTFLGSDNAIRGWRQSLEFELRRSIGTSMGRIRMGLVDLIGAKSNQLIVWWRRLADLRDVG